MSLSMDALVTLCKGRGFIFPGSEIYGGMANSWDYGPLGVELKNNIKQAWWKKFVTSRLDMTGLDAALIMNPKVWEASGHVATFSDPLVECKECHERYRADHIDLAGACQKCGKKGTFTEPAAFNMMMRTFIGPKDDGSNVAYFRPETAQAIFVDFANILRTERMRLPFGVGQIGKAFRNEITPGNFIFRQREFEQMEIEYFVKESEWEQHFDAWLKAMHEWIVECGISKDQVHDLEVPKDELAHYSKRTIDIEYDYPFGRKELYGLAYRTDFDLKSHAAASGKDLLYTDPDTNEKFIPHVIEPSFGVDRTFLAVMLSAYHEEEVEGEKRVVLRLPKHLAPVKVAVLPLSKKENLTAVSMSVAQTLTKHFRVDHSASQSIGKRYRQQDEIGTPFCVTVDFDTLGEGDAALKDTVTVRERDSMKQERIAIADLEAYLLERLK